MISHRPSLLEHADLLLCLQDGTVQTFGPSEQVWPMLTGQPHRPVSALARTAAAARRRRSRCTAPRPPPPPVSAAAFAWRWRWEDEHTSHPQSILSLYSVVF